MKKILSFILCFVVLFALAGCLGDNDAELKASETAFNSYLADNKMITVEEIDAIVTENEMPEIPTDFFSNIALKNLSATGKVKTSNGEENVSLYVWQNGGKIFVSPASDQVGYIDLVEMESAYDEVRQNSDDLTGMKPSEIIDSLLSDPSLEGQLGTINNLESILSLLSFKNTDFMIVEVGKFSLKLEVLFEKMATITGTNVEQVKAAFEQSGSDLNIYIYFDGKNITGYELVYKNTEVETTMIFKLSFTYNEDVINGLTFSYQADENILSFNLKVENKTLIVKLNVSAEGDNMVAEASIANDKLIALVKFNDQTIVDIDLTFADLKVDNKHSFSLSGHFTMVIDQVDDQFNTLELNIQSGNDVVIPAELVALEETATNLLQAAGEPEEINPIE